MKKRWKNFQNLWNKGKLGIKKDFTEELTKKNYSLATALYKSLLELVEKFKKSESLDEFISRVEDIQCVESYFPKDKSIQKFKRKVREDYNIQISLVLEELEDILLNIYAKRHLELQNQTSKENLN